jgi:sigma-E factor negative regulatory protein RseB
MYTDGLVEVSVYVNKSKHQQRPPEYVYDGATIVLNQVISGIEVSIVGKIPVHSAKAIAESIRFTGT